MSNYTVSLLPANTYVRLSAQTRLERSHFQCMSHPDFALLSGIFMIGSSAISSDVPTACTDGVNKLYGEAFVGGLTEQEMNALVLHENGHVMLRHMHMYRELYKLDAKRANMACDYIINGWIKDTDPFGAFAVLPKGGLYKPEYSNMTVKEIFDLLGEEQEEQQQQATGDKDDGSDGAGFDSHDWTSGESMPVDEEQALGKEIEQAIREGVTLVGKLKGNIDRRVTDALVQPLDWRVLLQDFMSSLTQGRDAASWRRLSPRYAAKPFNMLMPHHYSETIGEVVLAVDTSGSITDEVLAAVISEMVNIVQTVNPECIRILWWDGDVQKEQIIRRDQSSNIAHLAQASGGGGTRLGCVSEYIIANNIKPECIIVFTDGYVEHSVDWQTNAPSMFIVDGNRDFPSRIRSDAGKVVFKN
jgi:predicted metal-dependent peptidase